MTQAKRIVDKGICGSISKEGSRSIRAFLRGLRISPQVFGWGSDMKGNMQPDWSAVRDYIEQKKVAYRPPADDPTRKLSVIIDSRKYVPFYWVARALDTTVAAGVNDIQFAAPEIPY